MTARCFLKGFVAAAGLMAVLSGCAGGDLNATNTAEESRFIPIELWAGTEWDGQTENNWPRLDAVTGKNSNRTVKGPISWSHPETGKQLKVYERVKERKRGTKRQLYTINSNGSVLGRVFDSRPGAQDRMFVNDAFFPIGWWKRGEERSFSLTEFTPAGPVERIATIKIRRLDYSYRNAPHSLKYDWILRDEGGRILFHENYVYSPGKSLVRFRDRARK